MDNLPPNLKVLFENYVEGKISLLYGEPLPGEKKDSELKNIYSEYLSHVSLGLEQEDILNWCIHICEKRVNHIVSGQHRKSYGKAATLTVACSEVLKAKGKTNEASNLVRRIRNQFPRHRAFQDDLAKALLKS